MSKLERLFGQGDTLSRLTRIVPSGEAAPERLLDRLGDVTFEIGSKRKGVSELIGRVAPGCEVFISCLPRDSWQVLVDTASAVTMAGFRPVPHIPVRRLASVGETQTLLADLHGVGVERLLVIAGDAGVVKGPFSSSLELLESGLLARHGIASIFVAGHPEGSDYLEGDAAFDVLAAKIAAAQGQGLTAGVVTQFCFAAAPYEAWLKRYRQRGLTAPVRLGLAGPASAATLLRLALRCGIGDSLGTLQRRLGTATALLKDSVAPDEVVLDLRDALAADIGGAVAGFHVFPFGGLAKAVSWHRSLVGRLNLERTGDRLGA